MDDSHSQLLAAIHWARQDDVELIVSLVKDSRSAYQTHDTSLDPLACCFSSTRHFDPDDQATLLRAFLPHIDVNFCYKDGSRPLTHCKYDPHLCKILIDAGADVGALAWNSQTILHQLAMDIVEARLDETSKAKLPELLSVYVQAGASLEARNQHGETPLLLLVNESSPSISSMLATDLGPLPGMYSSVEWELRKSCRIDCYLRSLKRERIPLLPTEMGEWCGILCSLLVDGTTTISAALCCLMQRCCTV